MSMLEVALDPATVIVAVDPGKVLNRVWVSNGVGFVADPVSLPVARDGIARLERLLSEHGVVDPVIAIEATAACIVRGWRSWSGAILVRCGCSRHQRPRLLEFNWGQAGLRPMTVTVRR